MADTGAARVVIVDYGMGNLFSVRSACAQAGLQAAISGRGEDLLGADGVILPGVGAFGDAMESLRRLELVEVLRDVARAGRPLMGICLGLQLLMTESHEFGRWGGLGLVEGQVERLPFDGGVKVPQVGWNRIYRVRREGRDSWADSPLAGLAEGEFMYFVHSYYARPVDPGVPLAVTRYGDTEFCSAWLQGNVFACQFHPERSGRRGLEVYRNFAGMVTATVPSTRSTNV